MKNKVRQRTPVAVILAGGEGKRLRPLTASAPKPLLKIGGVPVIKNILSVLARSGINKAAITVGYKGEMIKEALGESFRGVELTYFAEEEPLGSAGGVKRASNFITEDEFIVICGDAMFDFDLNAALDYFYSKDTDGVILCDDSDPMPLEYGIVTSDQTGRVTAFVEKPSWSGMCMGSINTGMYIFKREVLELIPEGKYDFGFDLFSKMLSMGKSLYSYNIKGEWCDVGTIADYYKCNMKASGGENVIGTGCQLDPLSKIESSVIGDGVMIGGACKIESAVIGDGAVIGDSVKVEKGAVIGPYAVLGDRCLIGEGAIVPQGQMIKSGELLQNPLYKKDLFTRGGIYIRTADERTVYTLGSVIRKCMTGKNVAVMYDESPVSIKNARVLMLGLCTSEGLTHDIGKGFSSLASFAARTEKYDLTVLVLPRDGGLLFRFYDSDGLYPGAAFENQVRHSTVCVSSMSMPKPIHSLKIQSGIREKYMEYLIKSAATTLKGLSVTVYISGLFGRMLSEAFEIMGAILLPYGGHVIISGDEGGDHADIIYDGVFFDFDHLRGVCILAYSEMGYKEITLPHRCSEGLKIFVREKGMRLSLCAENYYDKKEKGARRNIPKTPALFDGGAGVMLFLNYVLTHRLGGKEVISTLPVFSTKYKSINIPESQKAVIAKTGKNYDKEGFVIVRNRGRIRIIPENGDNLSLCAEAGNIEDAAELIKYAEEYIKRRTDITFV